MRHLYTARCFPGLEVGDHGYAVYPAVAFHVDEAERQPGGVLRPVGGLGGEVRRWQPSACRDWWVKENRLDGQRAGHCRQQLDRLAAPGAPPRHLNQWQEQQASAALGCRRPSCKGAERPEDTPNPLAVTLRHTLRSSSAGNTASMMVATPATDLCSCIVKTSPGTRRRHRCGLSGARRTTALSPGWRSG